MRGYGRSSVYSQHAEYAQEHIVRDMIELLDAVGREKAVWVGHDWGSPVVWNLASHHPDRCHAVVSTAALIEEQPETEEVSTALPSYGLSSVL